MLQKVKAFMMPIGMCIGILFYRQVSLLSFVLPYAISLMLFLTYLAVDFKEIKVKKLHVVLVIVQLILTLSVYLLVAKFDEMLSHSLLILLIMPVASASAIITNMLGGSLESMTAYTIFNNIVISLVAPLFFALANHTNAVGFLLSFVTIAKRVMPLLLGPFVLSAIVTYLFPKFQKKIKEYKNISFYIWVVTLIIAVGMTIESLLIGSVTFIMTIEILIYSFVVCLILFALGRLIGSKYDDVIVGGQGFGQKNTLLGIWMALSFFSSPLVAIAPGAYIIAQNLVNSYQLWLKQKKQDVL